jgi:hypothetical protein
MSLSSNGRLSGTPEESGSFEFILRVTDADQVSVVREFIFEISNPPPPLPAPLPDLPANNDVPSSTGRLPFSLPPALTSRQFAVGGDVGSGAVRVLNPDFTERFSLIPFPGFTGGVRTAAADFSGDGVADVVAGTGPGRSTQLIIYNGQTQEVLFRVDPFEASFTGGIYVAAGDMDGDGLADLVVTPDEGGGPRARIFSGDGFRQIADFLGIDDSNFRGGARVVVGDINGDGIGDLIVVAGFGGGPRVAGFDGAQLGPNGGPKLFGDFLAFEPALHNGVFVSAGDVDGDGDGFADLVVGGGPGGAPRVSVIDGRSLLQAGQVLRDADFFAGDIENREGVRVTLKNIDEDNHADLIVGPGTGAGSSVTVYAGLYLNGGDPPMLDDFEAFNDQLGVNVG